MLRRRQFRPFAGGGRRTVVAIFATFALVSVATVLLSIAATSRSQNRATVVEIAGRQRTLAERYVQEVLLVRAGQQADPALTADTLAATASALLNGGTAPAVAGDDDATTLSAASGQIVRNQLIEEQHLVRDLAAYGSALLAGRPLANVPETGGEHITKTNPLLHLRVLGALTSANALNLSRSIAAEADSAITNLIAMEIVLGVLGLLVSVGLAGALLVITRRQSAHFRSLVNASTDLALVIGDGGCRYASRSLATMVGRTERELLGEGFARVVHDDDQKMLEGARQTGSPASMMLRVRNAAGEWRHIEAHLTDMRDDRHLRGILINARDVTRRVLLEHELAAQAQRDTFGSQLVEALEMADEESAAYDVVERAMIEISRDAPMELLLSDSSRSHLERSAIHPHAGAPACPVESPFECVAVRRGNPVTFDSSEALNACPKLRGRAAGACSAACVPVGFMGRALGVLHAIGPENQPPSAQQIAQLTTLATQAGARIGTVRAFEKSQLQASTDTLTGLINRRTFESRVRGLIHRSTPFALAVVDLDRFKAINDTHGHEAGDRALRMFAALVADSLRDNDIFARWGGEEFVIALPGIDRHDAVAVLDRLRDAIADGQPGDAPRFSASFGVTDSTVSSTLDQMLKIADHGLYVSKQTGRDRVTIGDPELIAKNAPERRNGHRPLLQTASEEEDPRPSGAEIR